MKKYPFLVSLIFAGAILTQPAFAQQQPKPANTSVKPANSPKPVKDNQAGIRFTDRDVPTSYLPPATNKSAPSPSKK
jgi:hypothetical protein